MSTEKNTDTEKEEGLESWLQRQEEVDENMRKLGWTKKKEEAEESPEDANV